MSRMSIWVTGSFIGYHRYPDAPDDVQYLRNLHRHIFNWKAEIFVSPSKDRQLEFHQVQGTIVGAIAFHVNFTNTGSCETIAKAISDIIWTSVGHFDHTTTVDEDEECGSTYYFEQDFLE